MPFLIGVLLTLSAACGGHEPDPTDAATDAGADTAASEPEPPHAPALPDPPRLEPCPEGFIALRNEDERLVGCTPYPDGVPTCTGATGAFVGSNGCVAIGPPCPSGLFPKDAPEGAVFVAEGAEGGDGSRASPLGALADALEVADGRVIMLGRGEYEALFAQIDVDIRGACVEDTIVKALSEEVATLYASGVHQVRISNVTIEGGTVGIAALYGATVVAEDVLVHGATQTGVLADGGRVEARGLVVRDVGAGESAGGARAQSRGTLVLDGCEITNVRGPGIEASGAGSVVEANGCVVARTRGELGSGIFVMGEATGRFDRVLVADADAGAAYAYEGSDLTVARSHLTDAAFGVGVDGANLVMEATSAYDLTGPFAILGRGSDVTMNDTLVTHLRSGSPEYSAVGVIVFDSSTATMRRISILDVEEFGVQVTGDADLFVTDLAVSDVSTGRTPNDGTGLIVAAGSSAHVERATFEGLHHVGVTIGENAEASSVASLVDVTIRDVRGNPVSRRFGYGLSAGSGSRVTLERVAIADTRGLGAFFGGAAVFVTGSDLDVHDVHAQESDLRFGRGVEVSGGAQLDLARVRIAHVRDIGLSVFDVETSVALTELRVSDVAERACATEACGDRPFGIGVGAYSGSAASITTFTIDHAPLCAVHLSTGAMLDLAYGTLADSGTALCLDVGGYDVDRLRRQVVSLGNASELDATSLPVPESSGTFE